MLDTRVGDDAGIALAYAQRFRGVMIEGQMHAFHIGQVGGDVAIVDLDLAVLHVLRMDELDVVDQLQLLEQHGAYQAVEVATGDKTVRALGGLGHSPDSS